MSFFIRDVKISSPVVLAPMAGVTDITFRRLCKPFGVGLMYTEMISAMALTFSNKNTIELLKIDDNEHPVCVQLFGSDPAVMAKGARLVEPYCDIIDINMGCPAGKIVKNKEGSALMGDPDLAFNIVKKVVEAVSKPVTVKIRKGIDSEHENGVELAKILVEAGASAIAVHARNAAEQYSGNADWPFIKKVVESVDVPVIGNGDIKSAEDAVAMMNMTGCKAIMIGRKSLGNPWIFEQVTAFLNGQKAAFPKDQEKIDMALLHLSMMVAEKGIKSATSDMRKHLAWYIKGMKDATTIRDHVNKAQSMEELVELFNNYSTKLKEDSEIE